jgi:hypothetical protein
MTKTMDSGKLKSICERIFVSFRGSLFPPLSPILPFYPHNGPVCNIVCGCRHNTYPTIKALSAQTGSQGSTIIIINNNNYVFIIDVHMGLYVIITTIPRQQRVDTSNVFNVMIILYIFSTLPLVLYGAN